MLIADTLATDTCVSQDHLPRSHRPVVGYTFVEVSNDVAALAEKRPVKSKHRHAIRSHVMRTIRRTESLQGKKRQTGKDKTTKPTASTPATDDRESSHLDELLHALPLPDNVSNQSPKVTLDIRPGRQWWSTDFLTIPISPSDDFDPFCTLPAAKFSAQKVAELLKYSKYV